VEKIDELLSVEKKMAILLCMVPTLHFE